MTRVNLGLDTSSRPLVVDATTLAKVRAAEARLGHRFVIVQGSWRAGHGADASGPTHDRGGVVDLRSWDLPASVTPQEAVRVLRQCGLVAWYRTPAQGFDPHIHAVDRGNPDLDPSAAWQVAEFLAGRNGLKGCGPDDGPRVEVPVRVPGPPLNHVQQGRRSLRRAVRLLRRANDEFKRAPRQRRAVRLMLMAGATAAAAGLRGVLARAPRA